MLLKRELEAALSRVLGPALTFLTSLLMAAIFVGSGILLEHLVGLAVGNETLGYRIVSYALDITLVGCAVVWAIAGAIVATWEAFTSVKNVVSRPRD